jgi:hypothetical protein
VKVAVLNAKKLTDTQIEATIVKDRGWTQPQTRHEEAPASRNRKGWGSAKALSLGNGATPRPQRAFYG